MPINPFFHSISNLHGPLFSPLVSASRPLCLSSCRLPHIPSVFIPEEVALAKGLALNAAVAILVVMGVCMNTDGIGIAIGGGTATHKQKNTTKKCNKIGKDEINVNTEHTRSNCVGGKRESRRGSGSWSSRSRRLVHSTLRFRFSFSFFRFFLLK